MAKSTVKDVELKGKKVLVRVGFNVPLKNGVITNDNRITAALPTIKYIIEQGDRAIAASDLARKDIFLTTKVWNDKHDYELAKASIEEFLEKLGVDYVDLLLIHWPNPKAIRDSWKEGNAGAWKAMEEAYKAGKVRAIGVSNFMIHHLEALFETAEIKPQVNQVLLAPGCPQEELAAFCRQHDILLEAYSPLGTGSIFKNEAVQELAAKYGKSVAQVALAWSLQKGFLPLPKSVTPANIEANLAIFGIELSAEDMAILDKVEGVAAQSNPDEVNF